GAVRAHADLTRSLRALDRTESRAVRPEFAKKWLLRRVGRLEDVQPPVAADRKVGERPVDRERKTRGRAVLRVPAEKALVRFVEQGDSSGGVHVEGGAADWGEVAALLEADVVWAVPPRRARDDSVGFLRSPEGVSAEVDVHAASQREAPFGRCAGACGQCRLHAARRAPEDRVVREAGGRLREVTRNQDLVAAFDGSGVHSERE